MLKEVICENIPKFPDMEITFKDGTLKLEAEYYIRRVGNKCYSTLFGKDLIGKMWLLGDPLLFKYYTEYNMNPRSPSVTFYEAKE